MRVLVVHASRYGSTAAIAARIAQRLTAGGHTVEARRVRQAPAPEAYDAIVIGSALYFEHWMRPALRYVRRHRAALASRPVWLFSSGPVGSKATDDEGRDLREVTRPKETVELRDALHPRDHRVFFGALDLRQPGFLHLMTRMLPAAREMIPEGDFRDWADIEAWADHIAQELAVGAAEHVPPSADEPMQPAPTAQTAPMESVEPTPRPELRPRWSRQESV